MLSENIGLLLILPLLIFLWGIARMVKGIVINDFFLFRTSFFLYITGLAFAIFFLFVGRSYGEFLSLESELSNFFLIVCGVLGIVSILGIIFDTFNNFIPVFLTRFSLFLAVVTLISGSFVSYQSASEKGSSRGSSNSKFIIIDDMKANDSNNNSSPPSTN